MVLCPLFVNPFHAAQGLCLIHLIHIHDPADPGNRVRVHKDTYQVIHLSLQHIVSAPPNNDAWLRCSQTADDGGLETEQVLRGRDMMPIPLRLCQLRLHAGHNAVQQVIACLLVCQTEILLPDGAGLRRHLKYLFIVKMYAQFFCQALACEPASAAVLALNGYYKMFIAHHAAPLSYNINMAHLHGI